MHFLYYHLNIFADTLGAGSDEQGETFHQDVRRIETKYQCRRDWDKKVINLIKSIFLLNIMDILLNLFMLLSYVLFFKLFLDS